MNKENKISGNNLVYALLFLVLGLVLLTSTEDVISIVSKGIGLILIITGVIKSIIYIYMKGKLGNYNFIELIISLILILTGVSFIVLSGTFSFVIRTVIGIWVVFIGINRMIYAFTNRKDDMSGFKVYLITSIFMIALGVVLISGIFDKIVGLLIILYSAAEIINYIYYKTKLKNYEPVTKNKKAKKTKALKNTKVVDAVIEEDNQN